MNHAPPFTLSLIVLTLSLTTFALCPDAHADACNDLANNRTWNDGLSTLGTQMNQKNWNEALKTAEKLNDICERSPILNYAMGRIYRGKGDDTRSLYYMQRATRFTEEFAVKGNTLEQMWFDRYEAEHPEARPEAIKAREQEIEELRKNARETHEKDLMRQTDDQYGTLTERAHYATGMWTGVAIAGAGVAMTAIGAVMVFNYKKGPINTAVPQKFGFIVGSEPISC